jgi:hypothetical protein
MGGQTFVVQILPMNRNAGVLAGCGRERVKSRRGRGRRNLSPATAGFQIMDAAPQPSSTTTAKQNLNRGLLKLALHVEKQKDVWLAVKFRSTQSAGDQSRLTVAALNEW